MNKEFKQGVMIYLLFLSASIMAMDFNLHTVLLYQLANFIFYIGNTH